jgi:hypothetical protein
MGEMRNACRILGRKPEERTLWRPRHRWENNIKMDLKELGSEGMTGFMWLRIESSGGFLGIH